MTPIEQTELQTDLNRYGMTLGQLQYMVSKMPIKWNSMSFNVQELMTKETVRQGIDGICDRMGYPAELMSGKNATYENRSSAEKFLYQNNVIPFSCRRMARYNKFFGLDSYLISMNYSHLPVLQEDVMKESQSKRYLSQSLLINWNAGIITFNEYRIASGYEEVSGMDIYYPEYLKQFPLQVTPNSNVNKKESAVKSKA